jgi:L-lactate dehydrogenase (cytochrome)
MGARDCAVGEVQGNEAMGVFGNYQNEIYLAGLGEVVPELPADLTRLEAIAEERMPSTAFGYVAGSAGSEATARANRAAFDTWRLVPRMLRDVSGTDLSVTVLGTAMPAPVALAPVGVLGIVHPDGEAAVARAAASVGLPMVVSTAATTTLEDVAAAGGDAPRWFQLYWPNDRDLAASFLERAAVSGDEALVLTLDTHMMGWRPRDLDNAFLPFLRAVGGAVDDDNRLEALRYWASVFGNPTLTWDDLGFLREHWSGPIALKGILHSDDARRAADAGMDAVVVSNHGGRQVDGAVAALDALPAIADAVGDRIEVLMDSGIRSGADVIKALALGARAVLLGRPYVYGLGLAGEEGVRHVLRCLLAELELSLALSGATRVSDVDRELVVRSASA